MDPATISLIVMVISYYISSKSGKSKGQSAAIAAAAGVGTYYALSPDGLDLYNKGAKALGEDQSLTDDKKRTTAVNAKIGTSASTGVNGVLGTTADVLKSWGPTGTAAVIGTTAVSTSSSLQKYLPWVIGGLAAFLIFKK